MVLTKDLLILKKVQKDGALNELNDYEKTYFYNVLASAMKLKGVK